MGVINMTDLLGNDNILFATVSTSVGICGIFSNVGNAITGAEHIFSGDRVRVRDIQIGVLPEHDFIARVIAENGVIINIVAIEIDNCHSVDGLFFVD
jgi:hypothetical protein